MSVAIAVRGVSKRFKHGGHGVRTFKEHVITGLRDIRGRSTFWALRDIDLDVHSGTSVGILGPNGAGKTTLLRLMGGVGRPTSGKIDVHGRVGGILELGSGFHPDLTGRESVLLAGIIAGLTRREMRRRMDEIVEFAELQEFIDLPTRIYSTGMVARLAFSVATNVDAEILLVDEVLAVGDLAFQQRCMERFREFKRAGTTMVVVSHQPEVITDLCDETVWLQGGRILARGTPMEIGERYRMAAQERTLQETPAHAEDERTPGGITLRIRENRYGTQAARLTEVSMLDGWGEPTESLVSGGKLALTLKVVDAAEVGDDVHVVAHLRRTDGLLCLDLGTRLRSIGNAPRRVLLEVDRVDLEPGDYAMDVGLYSRDWGHTHDFHRAAYPLKVTGSDRGPGVIRPPHRWTID